MSKMSSNAPLAAAAVLPTVSVSAPVTSVVEGNRGSQTLTFVVTLQSALATDETVAWTIAGSGTNPANSSDLISALTGSLSFTAGITSLSVSVTIAADSQWEPDETFSITLSTPSSGISLGTATATATITNDDPMIDDFINVIGGNDRLVTNDDPLVGSINYANDKDVFEINVIAGQTYTIDLKGDATLDTFLELYSASGTLLAYNDNATTGSTNSSLTFTAATTGRLYASAMSYSLTATGEYSIKVTSTNVTNVVTGTYYNDNIVGTFGDDTISGDAGKDSIFGNYGNDNLFGDDGNDRINGGAGDDVIYLGGGRDRLFALDNAGHDDVADFTIGEDRINLARSSIHSFSDLVGHHLSDTSSGARISYEGSVIVLLGVSASSLTADDFIF